jgi:hypothetical protein
MCWRVYIECVRLFVSDVTRRLGLGRWDLGLAAEDAGADCGGDSRMGGWAALLLAAAVSAAQLLETAVHATRLGGSRAEDRASLLSFLHHGANGRVRDGRGTPFIPDGNLILRGWSDQHDADGNMESDPCAAGSFDNANTGWLGVMCDAVVQQCFEDCSRTSSGRRCRSGCSDSCACSKTNFCCSSWYGACDQCQDGMGNEFGCDAGDCGPGEGGRVTYVGPEGGKGLSGDVAFFAPMVALQWLVLNANPEIYGDVAALSDLTDLRMLNLRDTSVHGPVCLQPTFTPSVLPLCKRDPSP